MLPLSDQQKSLVAQLSLFKERLLAIDTRNPSLFLRREVAARCFDLLKLDATVVELAYDCVHRRTPSFPMLRAADESPDAIRWRRHLQQLSRTARAGREETGLEELYLGLCWLTGHVEPRTFLRGPLLLIPAELEQVHGKRDAGWHLRLKADEPVLNEAIIAAIRKHRGVRLPDGLDTTLREFLDALKPERTSSSVPNALFDELRARLEEAGLRVAMAEPQARALTKLTAAITTKEPLDLRLTGELVLGLFPQSSTALYADLETLIERATGGELDMGIVDNLLEAPADPTAPMDDEDHLASARTLDELPEGSVHAVVTTDPSQHLVLKQAQTAKCLVVRGPPGTGKSQVIVNLVADALARDKRVLVACQKRAALDVVFRRLDDVGLGGSAALVHDAAVDRAPLYKRLHAQLQVGDSEARPTRTAEAIAVEIDQLTRKLKNLVSPLSSGVHGVPLHDLYGFTDASYRPCLSLPNELIATSLELLRATCENVERAKPGRLTFDGPAHPLSARTNWAQLGHIESSQLADTLAELLAESRKGGPLALPPDMRAAAGLRAQLPAFLALKVRWYRWLLPHWWKARAAVQNATAWFGGATVDVWGQMLERHQKLATALERVGTVMKDSWREVHAMQFSNLQQLATAAERTREAFHRDLNAIRTHDRVLTTLSQMEHACLEMCTSRLAPEADWSRHMTQEVLLRWVDEAETRFPRLRDRLAEEHRQLRDLLAQRIEERRKTVAAELAQVARSQATVPSLDPAEKTHGNRRPSTDWNKLAHELGKKARTKPLRMLLREFAWPMKQQVRCWLASPEVVAEIFPLEQGHFDVVIFDEASQLTMERAVPVIYRGKQVVIAGDEQQMPPSDFFGASLEEEEEPAEEQPAQSEARFAESLLSQAKRIYGFRYLAWHYRSQHQELIEFSNHAFYDGALQVAANVQCGNARPPMAWIQVDGIWIDQTNPVEVVRVVDELHALLRDNDETPPSLGVITFNQKQQVAILDEIENRRKRDPEFERLYARAENPASQSMDDKPFVKNLENVQGDERDYIIFSIAYAKGPDGILRRNFGPLGLSGGEKRLNVAVTRAKKGVRVICSFDPDRLVVEGATNEGPKLLKKYLRYVRAVSQGDVERVHAILAELNPEHRAPHAASDTPLFHSPLEEQIYDALTARGLKLHTQWGAGGYHIDLVVVDPNDPDRLCLGIECDGASYHSGRSVRERDLARQSFLESRGWRIHRIWSSDWWRDPQREVQRVLALLPAHKSGAHVRMAAGARGQ